MFFSIKKIEQVVHRADQLQNPKNPGNNMVLAIFRSRIRTLIYTLYTKKANGEFWDDTQKKKIARRHWTPEMKAFEKQKVQEAPKPPFIFKLTVAGWIFVVFVIGVFGMMIYDSVKPPLPKPASYVAMEQPPAVGDVYFGHYEIQKEKGNALGREIRFGWFKMLDVEGGTYRMAKSTEMNKTHKPKEQLNSTDFETESLPPVKLAERTGYNLYFKSDDGLTEVYITHKK